MTTEDQLKAYKEGFKDGYDQGYKQGRSDAELLNPYVNTYIEQGRTPPPASTGAVGSDYFNKTPVSSNGAAGV
jgi:hypothetical protein